ncbi:MAG: hypothetical protein ACRDHU_04500 [Actinomycetota bacterium]
MRFDRDECGLVGKVILLWLVLVVLVILAVIDAGSIVLTRVRTADVARDAAAAGAEAFADTGERQEALRAARATLADRDEDASLEDLQVTRRGKVTVVVTDRAATLLVGRFGLLEDLRAVTATEATAA